MSANESVNEVLETQVVALSPLEAISRSEVDVQITTAHRYPRSVSLFKKKAYEMATISEEVAASCFYTLPARKGSGGKAISGPSVRLAEICAIAWGNLRYAARIIGDDGKMLTAQGVCHDLEANVAGSIEVKRRVTDKHGNRYSDDMVMVTSNAACSIAKRQAILGTVPLSYIKEIESAARRVAIGDAKTLATRRADMVAHFQKMGVDPARVFAAVEKKGLEDIGLEDLGVLKGLATAIRDGDTSVDQAFPEPEKAASGPPVGRIDTRKPSNGKPKVEQPATEAPPAATDQSQFQDDEMVRLSIIQDLDHFRQSAENAADLQDTAGKLLMEKESELGDSYKAQMAKHQARHKELMNKERYGKSKATAAAQRELAGADAGPYSNGS